MLFNLIIFIVWIVFTILCSFPHFTCLFISSWIITIHVFLLCECEKLLLRGIPCYTATESHTYPIIRGWTTSLELFLSQLFALWLWWIKLISSLLFCLSWVGLNLLMYILYLLGNDLRICSPLHPFFISSVTIVWLSKLLSQAIAFIWMIHFSF